MGEDEELDSVEEPIQTFIRAPPKTDPNFLLREEQYQEIFRALSKNWVTYLEDFDFNVRNGIKDEMWEEVFAKIKSDEALQYLKLKLEEEARRLAAKKRRRLAHQAPTSQRVMRRLLAGENASVVA